MVIEYYNSIRETKPFTVAANWIKANPIATVLSAAMMLLYAFDEKEASETIVKAVDKVLDEGYRTADLCKNGCALSTDEMTDKIIERL